MTTTTKTKLCWNCEGSVALTESNCPYCSVYLGPAVPVEPEEEIHEPVYQEVKQEEIPASPYAVQDVPEEEMVEEFDLKPVAMTLGLMLSGSVFFLFGLILFLFSDNGVFTLSWNAEYWYLYLVSSLPLLFFGWRSLHQLDS